MPECSSGNGLMRRSCSGGCGDHKVAHSPNGNKPLTGTLASVIGALLCFLLCRFSLPFRSRVLEPGATSTQTRIETTSRLYRRAPGRSTQAREYSTTS